MKEALQDLFLSPHSLLLLRAFLSEAGNSKDYGISLFAMGLAYRRSTKGEGGPFYACRAYGRVHNPRRTLHAKTTKRTLRTWVGRSNSYHCPYRSQDTGNCKRPELSAGVGLAGAALGSRQGWSSVRATGTCPDRPAAFRRPLGGYRSSQPKIGASERTGDH